ncbi:MAG: hypothetical protein LBV44_08600 [Methylobacillus sp.]|nr:hypothetical protein [Methylobacillus sp.]
MPIGKKYKGQRVESIPTAYLLWCASQENIRFTRWPLVVEMLKVLGERFTSMGDLQAELRVEKEPPKYWTPKKEARKERIANERKQLREQVTKAQAEAMSQYRARWRAEKALIRGQVMRGGI